ncbi:MAG TPA: hypothetical protein VJ020_10915 [Anaerolineales bacterium]|nr:hypothetical protein [Anaerolineales bacterium]
MSQQMSDVTSDDKLWAGLSYFFPLLALVALLMEDKKNRPFIKAHAAQALAAGIVIGVIAAVLGSFTCGIGAIVWFIMWFWAYKAYQGNLITIPVLTDFVKNQGWA